MTAVLVPDRVTDIPLDEITAGDNDRKTFDQAALEELAASIAANGLAQPITIRPVGARYEIVAGERRYRAVTILGWETIPALVRELDDETASRIMLIENLQREDLNPLEEADAYRTRLEKFGDTIEELAATVGKSPSHVKRRLDLAKLEPEILYMLKVGEIGSSVAWRMARLDANRQMIAARAYLDNPRMGAEKFTDLCGQLHLQQSQETMFADDWELATEELVNDAKRPPRAGRPALLASLRGLLDVVESTLGDDALDADELRAVQTARYVLKIERLRENGE